MDNRKNLKRALTGVLVGGMMFTGGIALAADTKSNPNNFAEKPFMGKGQHWGGPRKGMGHFAGGRVKLSDEMMAKLVTQGVITQKKADEIKSYIEKRIKERQAEGKKSGLLDELITNNILTQKQADSMQAKIREIRENENREQLSANLKSLVDKGIISPAQSGQILKKLDDIHQEREAVLEKTKDMTVEERHEYMQQNIGKRQNPIAQLVSERIITQEQANALKEVMFK